MELAPYGDLFALQARYRYYNRYLPEPFLWHVFDSLAASAEAMFMCSTEGLPPRMTAVSTTDRVVNFDIKNTNVFLGYAEHRQSDPSKCGGTQKYDYPVVKMGDFGLSLFTGPTDRRNPVGYFGYGTAFARPPVSDPSATDY